MKQSKKFLRGAWIGFLAVAIFSVGTYTGITFSTQASIPTYMVTGTQSIPVEGIDLSEFWRVWRLMDERFVYASTTAERLSPEERVRGAIQGMVGAFGDDYTIYMPPVETEEFAQEMTGEFSGVGMEVGIRDSIITVIAPIEGTPAKEAGMRAGDRILEIDGVSTKGMTVDAAVKMIRGQKGTSVILRVFRDGNSGAEEITIVRDTITIPTVKTEVKDGVFIVHLYTFNQIAYAKFVEAMREYASIGHRKMIIDLRGNPGGYMQTAIDIASIFVPKGGVILRERVGNEGQEVIHRSSGKTLGQYAPQKMVVLIDKGSASASEILAGALAEHGLATLIGEQSFGKGTVQELVDLPSSASLKVTIARWFTPEGNSINGLGLEPLLTATTSLEAVQAGEDPQMDAALRFLK